MSGQSPTDFELLDICDYLDKELRDGLEDLLPQRINFYADIVYF